MKSSSEIIIYGIHDTVIGEIVIAQSVKGLCWLGFMVEGYKGNGLNRLKGHFSHAILKRDDSNTKDLMHMILEAWEFDRMDTLKLDLRGTDFQKAVWHALMQIPKGQVCTYSDIANEIGKPRAARAVGSAVGENPVSLIVPCHRVVQTSGGVGNYGWGVDVKQKLLLEEDVSLAA